jgi:hypothetical protein
MCTRESKRQPDPEARRSCPTPASGRHGDPILGPCPPERVRRRALRFSVTVPDPGHTRLAHIGPDVDTIGPVVRVELERVEALELLGMTLAHLNDAEARVDMSPRVPLLMAIRDKLASALREDM